MPPFKLESDPATQTLLYVLGLVLGALFLAGGWFLAFDDPGSRWAVFALGGLLSAVSLAGLVLDPRREIVVDPVARRVSFIDRTRFGASRRMIGFATVRRVSVAEMGDNEGGSVSYDIQLDLDDGRKAFLLGGGCFEGRYSESTVRGHARRISRMIGLG